MDISFLSKPHTKLNKIIFNGMERPIIKLIIFNCWDIKIKFEFTIMKPNPEKYPDNLKNKIGNIAKIKEVFA